MFSVLKRSSQRALSAYSIPKTSPIFQSTNPIPSTFTMDSKNQSTGPGEPKSFAHFLNERSTRRQPSLIREMTKRLATAEPGTIFMAGGLPNPDLFPFVSLSVEMDGNRKLALSGQELRASLQYQPTLGYPPLHAELRNLVQRFFSPPQWSNSELIVTVGSQNALSAVLEILLEDGDPIVVPGPCYSSALSIMAPYSPTYLSIPEDAEGMQPDALRSVLKDWHGKANGKNGNDLRKPKILYVNPTGANPSGTVIPTERKKEIYRIAQEYDLLILEDDPYYFLHFLQQEPTSFLSMDVDGRVIRFDSFSKVLSSGLRVGFATGPKDIIRALELHLQASILHASSLSQVLVNGALRSWGIDGLTKHVDSVKALYKRRRDLMIAAAEKHLSGLAEWSTPQGGMFLWVKILGVDDTFQMIMERGLERKIMALPGREFMADKSKPCPYIRLSFSVIPENQIEQGIARLAELVKEERERFKKVASH